MADYQTLTLEREIACSSTRLFHILTDRDLRQQWSGPDEGTVIIDHFDCRPGGREETRCGPKEAPEFNTITNFHVLSSEFLSFTETLVVGGQTLSVSLCGQEITATAEGSLLRTTLQVTSLAGSELFEEYLGGWTASLDKLAALASSDITS